MLQKCIFLVVSFVLSVVVTANAQVVGYRFALNSSVFVNELGDADVLSPALYSVNPTLSAEKYTAQPSIGLEGELLIEVSPMSLFGVELEYSKLKGYNNTPPVYNYYSTSYYEDFQSGKDLIVSPVAYNTTMLNLAVNWKYFFFKQAVLQPFLKLTGVVSFVGTDFFIRNSADAEGLDSKILYSRGTSESEQQKLPAFHLGGGIGFDYSLNDRWSLQVDATFTAINTDLINGVPNFTYVQEDGYGVLSHNKCWTLTAQMSAGLVYYIEVDGSRKGSGGKTSPHLPFYRRKL